MTYPFQIIEKQVGNLIIRIIGVRHTEEFFEEQRDFFRRDTENAETVFLEDFECTHPFYGAIQKLVNKYRPFYVPDIETSGTLLLDATQFVVGYHLTKTGIKMSIKKKKPASRRSVITSIAAMGTGIFLCSGSVICRGIELLVRGGGPEVEHVFRYGTVIDYRNIVCAENIERLSTVLELEGPIHFFIGAAHTRGIATYLENPELRIKKRVLYAPQDAMFNTKIKKYEYKEGLWQVSEEI